MPLGHAPQHTSGKGNFPLEPTPHAPHRWAARLFVAAFILGGFPLSLVAHQGTRITGDSIRLPDKAVYLLAPGGIQ